MTDEFFGTCSKNVKVILSGLPAHLLKRDHRIIFCKNEQRWVLQIVNSFGVSDDAWKELGRLTPRFGVVL